MPVNLMQGKLDGGDEKKNNSIDLTLEKKASETDKKIETEKHPKVKEIKVKVPSDIKLDNSKAEGGSLKIVAGIVVMLMLSTGVLLFLLNSESQDLRGSVNVLPETNSTQIVDDILAEDFTNEASQNAAETEQVQVEENQTDSNELVADNTSVNSVEENTTSQTNDEVDDEPIVIDTSSIIGQNEPQEEVAIPLTVEPTTDAVVDNDQIIQEYDIQNSAEVTEELLTDVSNNSNNDFTPEVNESNDTVMQEVTESEEIQGETGPGLWISVIVASILSYAYARRNESQLG